MHPIWLARLDTTRPVLVLTREEVRAVRQLVTVAPITSTVRGLRSEVLVGQRNGALRTFGGGEACRVGFGG